MQQYIITPAKLVGHPRRHNSLRDWLFDKQYPQNILLCEFTQLTGIKTTKQQLTRPQTTTSFTQQVNKTFTYRTLKI